MKNAKHAKNVISKDFVGSRNHSTERLAPDAELLLLANFRFCICRPFELSRFVFCIASGISKFPKQYKRRIVIIISIHRRPNVIQSWMERSRCTATDWIKHWKLCFNGFYFRRSFNLFDVGNQCHRFILFCTKHFSWLVLENVYRLRIPPQQSFKLPLN